MTYPLLRVFAFAALGPLLLAACASEAPVESARPQVSTAAPAPASDSRVAAAASADTPFGLYLAGEAAIDGGSSRQAAGYFGRASQLEPSQNEVRARAFTTALVAGDVERAAQVAQGPAFTETSLQHLGRLTQAVEALAEDKGREAYALLAVDSVKSMHDQAVTLLKPWAAAAAGDWAAATRPVPDVGDPVAGGVAELGRAELLERWGKSAEAEAVYKPRAVGKNGLFILGYGGFLERAGRRPEAQALYDRAVAENPSDGGMRGARARLLANRPAPALTSLREGGAEALIAPAAMLLARREGDNGLAYLRLALRLDPSLDEAWVLVGDAMNAAGDTDSAKEAYRKVKPRSDQYVPAASRLALLSQQAGDKEGALRMARDTLAQAPDDTRAMVLYADLLREDDRFEEAIQVLNRAIAGMNDAEVGWSLHYVRGVAEERAGHWPQAEADLQQALKLKPDEPQVLNYLGYAWADRGEHLKEALAMLERAAALQPRSGAIVDSLGWARYRTGSYRDAARDLEKAVLLDPSDPEVNNHLGDAYWRTGRQLEARFQWQRVLTLDPDAKTRASVTAKLASGLDADTAGEGVAKP